MVNTWNMILQIQQSSTTFLLIVDNDSIGYDMADDEVLDYR